MTRQQIEELAVPAFQQNIRSWEEYGVSDRDAAVGILSALYALGIVSIKDKAQIEAEWAARDEEERIEREERIAAELARLTPEQRTMRELLKRQSKALQDMYVKQLSEMSFSYGLYFDSPKKPKSTA
jgi:hypothetical protein